MAIQPSRSTGNGYRAVLDAALVKLRTMRPEQIEAAFPRIARVLAVMHPEIRGLPDVSDRLEAARQQLFADVDSSPVVRTREGVQFSLHECPLASDALEFRDLCCAARAVLSAVTGDEVEQSEWIVRGDPRCTFEARAAAGRR